MNGDVSEQQAVINTGFLIDLSYMSTLKKRTNIVSEPDKIMEPCRKIYLQWSTMVVREALL
jgi:hypothetical protein